MKLRNEEHKMTKNKTYKVYFASWNDDDNCYCVAWEERTLSGLVVWTGTVENTNSDFRPAAERIASWMNDARDMSDFE